MAIAYGVMFIASIVLLVLYCALIRKKDFWLLSLYACVCVVNLGYLLLSLSKTLDFALVSNKIVYFGHIFALISMYLTITKLCGFNYNKPLPIVLAALGVIMFAIIHTIGYLPWYYSDVALTFENGAAKLIKEYGPLHVVYLIYVLVYFILMLITVIYSLIGKKAVARKQAGLLTAIVFCNIAMWIIEKFIPLNFEFLSVSYVLSMGMFFFLCWTIQDYVYKDDVVLGEKPHVIVVDSISRAEKIERILKIVPEGKKLTTRQMEMLEGILDGKSQKEIANDLNISENTVKWHTGLLYDTLNVAGREELFKLLKQD